MTLPTHAGDSPLAEARHRLRNALCDILDAHPLTGWMFKALGTSGCGNCWKCLKDEHNGATGWLLSTSRFILCPLCGNKRCPHASDHDLPCTHSNAPGQPGSVYQ